MQYMGSKNRIAKEIVPIIESYLTDDIEVYIEPFVGGANVIDKINFKNKVGYDIHEELVELLKYTRDSSEKLPDEISESEYKKVRDAYKQNSSQYEKWYYGLVGFTASFGAKWFGGYAKGYKADKVTPRNYSNEAIRNLKKQAPNLKGIIFKQSSYNSIKLDNTKKAVIYCDPPYDNTTKYKNNFAHNEFWEWVRTISKHHIVLVSEYQAPDDFEIIWEKSHKVSLGSGVNEAGQQLRVERLFKMKERDNS